MITGHGFRLALMLAFLAVVTIVLSGGLFNLFSTKITWALLGFTGWLCLGVPFSVWRGGSFGQFKFWLVSLVSFLLLTGCVNGLEQSRRAMETVAMAVLVIEFCSFFLGTSTSGKDVGRLSFVSGTLANSNDLATLLLMGLPFCLLVVRARSGFSVLRVAAMAGLILIPLSVVRTGSRGGLLTLALLFMVYFVSIPAIQKVPVAIGALILVVAALMVASSTALDRYRTIFRSSDAEYYSTAEASAELSAINRKQLLLRSLSMTLHHPLMGVGPGMFKVADANEAEEEGSRASWHESHNMYTQISSENGLPGLALYVAAIFFCFKAARAGRNAARQYPDLASLHNMAFCLQLSLLAFAVASVFASNAYYFYFPLVAGVSASFERAVAAEIALRTAPPADPGTRVPPSRPIPPVIPPRQARTAVPARSV
jgi:O-antigen ligase